MSPSIPGAAGIVGGVEAPTGSWQPLWGGFAPPCVPSSIPLGCEQGQQCAAVAAGECAAVGLSPGVSFQGHSRGTAPRREPEQLMASSTHTLQQREMGGDGCSQVHFRGFFFKCLFSSLAPSVHIYKYLYIYIYVNTYKIMVLFCKQ